MSRNDKNRDSPHELTPESELLRGDLHFRRSIFYCTWVVQGTAVVAPRKPWLRKGEWRFRMPVEEQPRSQRVDGHTQSAAEAVARRERLPRYRRDHGNASPNFPMLRRWRSIL